MPPPDPTVLLSLTNIVLNVTFADELTLTPAPLPSEPVEDAPPKRMVTRVALEVPEMKCNTRWIVNPLPVAAWIKVLPALAPLIVMFDVISKSPPALASSPSIEIVVVYVPAGKVITSSPASALASVIAARKVHCAAVAV